MHQSIKCARLHLQERSKIASRSVRPANPDEPRRYCQKRFVNPDHEEDPRWIDVCDRFFCNDDKYMNNLSQNDKRVQRDGDIFLSVQNIKFQGNENNSKRPRTGFKYKAPTDRRTHRMFVKQIVQVVQDAEHADEDTSSQLTCYYYDDYAKYLSNPDRSRPSSSKSSIFLQTVTRYREHKAVQVDITKSNGPQKIHKSDKNLRKSQQSEIQNEITTKEITTETATEDTKISFHKAGKRKSLTISRTQSPETVQVIRVDVVCNHSGGGSGRSDSVATVAATSPRPVKLDEQSTVISKQAVKLNNSHFAHKYLLTNTTKTLDENVSGGAKVTLLCKTFKLTNRSRITNKKNIKFVSSSNLNRNLLK